MPLTLLNPLQLKHKLDSQDDTLLLDVREPIEFDYCRIEGSVLIPLTELQDRAGEIDRGREIIVICHHGIRSKMAADYLIKLGFTQVSNLVGGIDQWAKECDPGVARY